MEPSRSRRPRFHLSGIAPVRIWVRTHPFLSLFVVLAILQLAEGGVWFVSNQHRIDENQAAITEINRLGKERRALVNETDRKLCLTQKESNKRIRGIVLAGPKGQAVFLHIIGIHDEAVIKQFRIAGEANAKLTASKFPDPDCGKLPSSKLSGDKDK